jgi:hypothetical protein
MVATFIVGHLSGAVLADTVPQAAVGAVLAAAVAVGLIKLMERAEVVPDA